MLFIKEKSIVFYNTIEKYYNTKIRCETDFSFVKTIIMNFITIVKLFRFFRPISNPAIVFEKYENYLSRF